MPTAVLTAGDGTDRPMGDEPKEFLLRWEEYAECKVRVSRRTLAGLLGLTVEQLDAELAEVGGHPSELDRRDLASTLASVGDTELCGLTRVEVSISRAR